ncbi:MAG: aminotransferase class I/II-fold pyridoxal phosphate-dependent enzyme, partial [Desulfovibrionales bacterium]|nr:aminotransferase class I/II-fold pyridoxal phosphate-dependent enzyme [Desulfovibrionales bacterium]
MIIGHGGNKEALARKLGCDINEITDMSCNLNPLGPPERIKEVIRENLDAIHSLPQPDAADICKGFAAYHGMDPSRVAAGNGTTWFLYTLPPSLGAQRVLILGPTYSDYRDGCRMHGVAYEHLICRPENNFAPDLEALARGARKADLVYICNPNNPTGALVEKASILDLVKDCPGTNFVIDESYL